MWLQLGVFKKIFKRQWKWLIRLIKCSSVAWKNAITVHTDLVLMKVRGCGDTKRGENALGLRVWALIPGWWCLITCWRSHLRFEIHRLVESVIRHPAGEVTDRAYWPPPTPAYCCVCVYFAVCGVGYGDVWAHAASIRPLIPGCFKAAATLEWNDTDTLSWVWDDGGVFVCKYFRNLKNVSSLSYFAIKWSYTSMRTAVAWIIVNGSDTWQMFFNDKVA